MDVAKMKKVKCTVCGKERISVVECRNYVCSECQTKQRIERLQEEVKQANECGEEPQTWSDDAVICPCCGAVNGDKYTPWTDMEELYEGGDHEIECWDCGKTFVLYTEVSYSWETSRKEQA